MPDAQRDGIADYDDDKKSNNGIHESMTRRGACQKTVVFVSARALGHLGFALVSIDLAV